MFLPLSSFLPGPTARISPLTGFSVAESGMMIPLVFFQTLHDHAIVQRAQLHIESPDESMT
jgi:hypothetical protein